jgi:NADH-quinone oxidoreductase subunit I
MKSIYNYIAGIFKGAWSLVQGMRITGKYFFSPRAIVTQQYPENRNKKGKKKLVMFDRFKGEVVMPHNEDNQHKCTGCGICEMNCPNGTIEVLTIMNVGDDGKKKRALDRHIYRLSMCTFCALCVKTCPSQAIVFSQEFEHAVFNRTKLIKVLNKPGSTLMKGVE